MDALSEKCKDCDCRTEIDFDGFSESVVVYRPLVEFACKKVRLFEEM
jgi:hypothetical protein